MPGEVFYGLLTPREAVLGKYPELFNIFRRVVPADKELTYYHLYVRTRELRGRLQFFEAQLQNMRTALDSVLKKKKSVKSKPTRSVLYQDVLNDVKVAYADLDRKVEFNKSLKLRKLVFTASEFVSRDEAIDIFKAAGVTSYNEFNPNLLKHFPKSAKILIERNSSVQITVECPMNDLPPFKKVKADSCRPRFNTTNQFVYWWD